MAKKIWAEDGTGAVEKVQESRKSMAILVKLWKAHRKKLEYFFNKLDRNKLGELSKDGFQIIIKLLSKDF